MIDIQSAKWRSLGKTRSHPYVVSSIGMNKMKRKNQTEVEDGG